MPTSLSLAHSVSVPAFIPSPQFPVPNGHLNLFSHDSLSHFTILFSPTKTPHPVKHTLACGFSFLHLSVRHVCAQRVESHLQERGTQDRVSINQNKAGKMASCTTPSPATYIYAWGRSRWFLLQNWKFIVVIFVWRWAQHLTPHELIAQNAEDCV